jgi:hypothetical protein
VKKKKVMKKRAMKERMKSKSLPQIVINRSK